MPLLGLALGSMIGNAGLWLVAGLGIGLVIFVHELGHFLVAKKCGVRVEIFSLGFGPRLFGFRRGDTDYRVCLVPIGGYVKMAGDNPGETLGGDPGELPSKSIGQRFAIFSAGVVMNLIFALITLPVVLAIGVQFHSTVVGGVAPGGPAWQAGIQAGDEILRVNRHDVYDFNDVIAGIALGDSDGVAIELSRGGQELSRVVKPHYDEGLGRFVVGVQPSLSRTFQVDPGGPAARVGVTGRDEVVSFNGQLIASAGDFEVRRRQNEAPQVILGVKGPDGTIREVEVRPGEAETPIKLIGIQPYENQVEALRGAAGKLADFVLPGDTIESLQVRADGGSPQDVKHIRDHDDLASALELARESDLPHVLVVRRDDRTHHVALPADLHPAIAADIALVQDPASCRVRLLDGYPAQSTGLPEGSQVIKVNDQVVRTWGRIKTEIDKAEGPIVLDFDHAGNRQRIEITPRSDVRLADFGMLPLIATVERRYGMIEAAKVGVVEAGFMLKNVFLTLKKIFSQDVSPKNLSGILTIAYVSKSLAESGIPSLFFFLAVLSLNLAFLNVLPIPVLDGGHLFFLLVEKIKGSPVSDRVMGYSQLVGLVLVLALLLYVTYQDLLKLFA